jgi:hypothetical protein
LQCKTEDLIYFDVIINGATFDDVTFNDISFGDVTFGDVNFRIKRPGLACSLHA